MCLMWLFKTNCLNTQILLFKFHHSTKFKGQKQAKYESQVPMFYQMPALPGAEKYWVLVFFLILSPAISSTLYHNTQDHKLSQLSI